MATTFGRYIQAGWMIEPVPPVTRGRDRPRKPDGRDQGTAGQRDWPAVRTWARQQGIEVPERGRILRSVVETCHQAHRPGGRQRPASAGTEQGEPDTAASGPHTSPEQHRDHRPGGTGSVG